MILGFKDQFVPYVLDGTKTHTIRAGARWRADMRADLFAKVRQKGMRLLFRAPVVRVEQIHIWGGEDELHAWISGEVLCDDELNAFFFRDGFRAKGVPPLEQAHAFWRDRLPFLGQIIHWDYAQRYIPCADCGRSHPLGPCNAMFRSDWRLPRPTRAEMAAR